MKKLILFITILSYAVFTHAQNTVTPETGLHQVTPQFTYKAVSPDSLKHYWIYNPLTATFNRLYTATESNLYLVRNQNHTPQPGQFWLTSAASEIDNTGGTTTLSLLNKTAATSMLNQPSPLFHLGSFGWGGSSQSVDWYIGSVTTSGASAPDGSMFFYSQINGSAIVSPIQISASGTLGFHNWIVANGEFTGGVNAVTGVAKALNAHSSIYQDADNDILYNGYFGATFVANSGLATVTISNNGTLYTNGTYTNVPIYDLTTGSTIGIALGTVVISGGAITSITPTTFGARYGASDNLTVLASDVGGTGSGLVAAVNTLHTYTGGKFVDLYAGGNVQFNGINSGTVVNYLGLDASNNVVYGTPTVSLQTLTINPTHLTGGSYNGTSPVTIATDASSTPGGTLATWDTHNNFSANNHLDGYFSVSGGGTLAVGSQRIFRTTGSGTTVKLPVASTIPEGFQMEEYNDGGGNMTVQSSGSNTIVVLPVGYTGIFTCILNSGTTAASWTYRVFGSSTSIGGGTLTSITPGWNFTSSTPITTSGTLTDDSTKVQTVQNFFPLGDTRYLKSTTAASTYQPIGTYVTAISGTTNRITSTGGTTPAIDISSTFEALLGKVANPLSQFASTTSAQLAGVLSDESGTGVVAYTINPVFTTPNMGTPSAINIVNATGMTSGQVTTALAFTPENVANKATTFGTLNNTLYPTTQAVANLGSVSATANDWLIRDANANAFVNNLIDNFTTSVMAGGTVTLTIASSKLQYRTGANVNETEILPVVGTFSQVGFSYTFVNQGTGSATITVKSSGGNTIGTVVAGSRATFTSVSTSGTGGASWDIGEPVVQASNGLNSIGGNVMLGGTIGAAGANLALSSGAELSIVDGSNQNQFIVAGNGAGNQIYQQTSDGVFTASLDMESTGTTLGFTNASGTQSLAFTGTDGVSLADYAGKNIVLTNINDALLVNNSYITKKYADSIGALKAPLASPTFTGTVTIPNGAAFGTPTSLTLTNATGLPYTALTGTPTIPTGANPSGTIGLTANNGTSTNFKRADANDALSQAIIPTWTGLHTFRQNALGATTLDAILLQNTTAAANNAQQTSPDIHIQSYGWGTTAGTSQSTDFHIYNLPLQNTVPVGVLTFDSSIAGGAYSFVGSIRSDGGISFNNATLSRGSIATTSTNGLLLENFSTATAGTPVQYTSRINQQATVWNTTATAAANQYNFAQEARGVSGTTPTASLYWMSSLVTTTTPSFTDRMKLDNNGNLSLLTGNLNLSATGLFNFNSVIGTANQIPVVNAGGTAMTWASWGQKPHTIFTPTTGGTVALINNQYNIINPAGALLALTVNLPSAPANNDCVFIKFTQNVTTVTYGNGVVVDGITAPTAGGLTVLTYDSGTTSWY